MNQVTDARVLYKTDFFSWTQIQAEFLRNNQLDKVDWKNILRELEKLGKAERDRLKSQMIRLLLYLLSAHYQPEKRTHSWNKSIGLARLQIEMILDDCPSLGNELAQILEESYPRARRQAATKTGLELSKFPEECPWPLKKVVELKF